MIDHKNLAVTANVESSIILIFFKKTILCNGRLD